MGIVDLSLPEDPALLEAAGRVALAHGQLELILRMTIKTLAGLSVDEALNATQNSNTGNFVEISFRFLTTRQKIPCLGIS